ncbi:MAG: pentapeptide repeat-containing protein, partial [Candidatus Eremiobacterota bacterium]
MNIFFNPNNINDDDLFNDMISYLARPLVPVDHNTEEEFWTIVNSDDRMAEEWAEAVDYRKAFLKVRNLQQTVELKENIFSDRKLYDTLEHLKNLLIEKHNIQFEELYEMGERHFRFLELENRELTNKNLEDCFFEECLISADFSNSSLRDSKFLTCNLKTSIFRNTDLTGALMQNCSVEATVFDGAVTDNFRFIKNYCYSKILNEKEFYELFR